MDTTSHTSLQGGGNMGKRLRNKDWAKTTLGPIGCWPASLKTAVSLVLDHAIPMMILWGDERVQIYNDGYHAIMGDKRTHGLGQPARARRPEMCIYSKPIYDRVRAGETVTLEDQLFTVRRNGKEEMARFTLFYSPLRDEYGAIAGVLVTVLDTTEHQQTHRKNWEKYRPLFDMIDEGFCIIEVIFDENSKAVDYRFLETNAAFEDHTDIENAEGRYMRDIAPDHEECWFETYGDVANTSSSVRFESWAKSLGRFYNVYAFPYGEPDENMVAILFRDVTSRKEAERALHESEKRLQLATRAADMHLSEVDLVNGTLKWVDEVAHKVRFPMPQTIDEAERLLHPDDKKKIVETLVRVADEGKDFEMEYRVVDPQTEDIIWVYSAGTAVSRENGIYKQIISATKNITERKRTEIFEQFLNRLNIKIQRMGDAEQIMAATARLLGERLNADRCTYAEIGHNENHYVIMGNYTRENMPAMEGSGAISDFGEEVLRLMRQNEPFIADDVARDERITQMEQAAFIENQIKALICIPVNRDGRFRAKIAVHQKQPRNWRSDEIELVRTVANRCREAIERARVSRELQEMNEKLEERVEKRTQELKNYQQELRSLASQLNKTEEQQRHRLAGELHDHLGQMLAVAKIDLDSLQGTELPRHAEDQIANTHKLIDDALSFTRGLMMELKPPPEIDRENIVDIFKWVAQNMEKYGLNVTIRHQGPLKPLNKDTLAVLHQCVRELLFNIIKHAGVEEARLMMTEENSQLRVTVEDRGRGIDPMKKEPIPTEEGGFGLFSIRERMNWLGGRLEIDSEPGQGTRATLYVPIYVPVKNN